MNIISQFLAFMKQWMQPKSESTKTSSSRTAKSSKKEDKRRLYDPKALNRYLEEHYEFRFNVLTGQTEYRPVDRKLVAFTPLDKRELNTLCIEVQSAGVHCWDRDLSRYICSAYIADYHPFRLYLDELPQWDGVDRLKDLATRVSDEAYWVKHFHRWMLGMTAQWMGLNQTHANSLAPLLVSEEQGWLKSTFCKSLMPEQLQVYYTDQVDLATNGNMESKLAVMGLINLDEFDRLTDKRLAKLKNLMQLPALNIRRPHQSHYRMLPRIASFIGTSNRKDLLSDPTGSRRFLCVDVKQKIDCSNIDITQIYAQLKAELLAGERYWFTTEDEQEIQEVNRLFYQVHPEEELFQIHFRAAQPDDAFELLSLVEIVDELRNCHRGFLSNLNLRRFSTVLIAAGVERIHTREGNRYKVVRICEGCEG